MKMTLGDVIKNLRNLNEVAAENKVFPTKLQYAIGFNIEKLQREAEHIERERKRLCEQFVEKDENGEPVMVKSVVGGRTTQEYKMSEEGRKLFEKDYNELLDTEVDVNIRTVKSEVIEQCEAVERFDLPRTKEMVFMTFMIEE